MLTPLVARRPPNVPILATFANDIAAPLPSPLGVDVGTLQGTDTNSTLSQSGGALALVGTPAAGDGVNSPAAVGRLAGRALLCELPALTTVPAGSPVIGWGQNPSATDGAVDIGVAPASATTARILTGATTIDTVTVGAAPLDLAMVMRGTGGFLLARSGRTGPYTLLWVYNTSSAAEYAKLRLAAAAINATVRPFAVVDLPAPWDRDYGIASTRLVNPPVVTTVYPHTVNFLMEFSFTYGSGLTYGVAFRTHAVGPSSNTWRCYASAGGTLVLDQRVADVATNRIAVASVFVNATAYRVVVVADANVYQVFVNDVLKGTYTDAGNFQVQETQGYVAFAGSPITDLAFWPRRLHLPMGVN
jgi:hypothetical protein